MSIKEKLKYIPNGIKRALKYLFKKKVTGIVIYITLSILATLWFLIRVIPKPNRALYPCMRVAAPIMSSLVIWLITLTGMTFAFKKAKQKIIEARYPVAVLLILAGVLAASMFTYQNSIPAKANTSTINVWYETNQPAGNPKGIYPGRVAWGHNPKITSWDGSTGFWWDDNYNSQSETDKLLKETLLQLTCIKSERKAWDELFNHFNQKNNNRKTSYQNGERIAIKINQNNTYSHESNNEINANPQLILSLLKSLINEAKIPQELIAVSDPSRFITDNIYDKCSALFSQVRYIDHNGGNGREKATFVKNAIPYSVDNGKVNRDLATCFVEADYIINLSLMKGHVSQGVTLSAKNYFGCTGIETDWRKNSHSSGFSQNQNGTHKYLVYPDFLGHKDLGGKTMLFLIDGIYSNKFVDRIPAFKWKLAPFNNHWPSSLFASQDGVAIDAVVLDFIIAEWPDAPDMMYSDYYLYESALAYNPPSGTVYDPEKDGSILKSLGVVEHWNNKTDKQYSRNLGTGDGIELIYKLIH